MAAKTSAAQATDMPEPKSSEITQAIWLAVNNGDPIPRALAIRAAKLIEKQATSIKTLEDDDTADLFVGDPREDVRAALLDAFGGICSIRFNSTTLMVDNRAAASLLHPRHHPAVRPFEDLVDRLGRLGEGRDL